MEKNVIRTGFSSIDDITGGFKPSELVIIAGRPGMRKTSLALSIVKNLAVDERIPCAYFSLKMKNVEVVNRLISIACDIHGGKIVNGQLNQNDWGKMDKNINPLLDSPLYLEDKTSLTIDELKGKIQKMVDENGIKLVIIDYLQLVDISDSRDRQLDLDIALCHLKEFAKKLNIVIVALSNLFLGNERPERMPLIADHNEFKTIGKHADWSFFIYRPELYGNRKGKNTCSIIISRDGNCPLSTTSLKYQWYTRRFNNN